MLAKELEEAGLTETDIEGKIIYLVSVWLEGLLYGMPTLTSKDHTRCLVY
jgi:hypothetical protein